MARTPQHILNSRRKIRTENGLAARRAQDLLESGRKYRIDRGSAPSKESAIKWAITKATMAVINSYGITPNVYVNVVQSENVNAYTDFQAIYVDVPAKNFKTDDIEQVGMATFLLKGFLYHEAGHILHTIPFLNLLNAVNQPKDKWAKVQWAWNALEDQRMETKMIEGSPVLQKYFTAMVSTCVITEVNDRAWLLVAGRKYLPRKLRKAAKEAALQSPVLEGRTEVVQQIHDVIESYKTAKTPQKMWDCVVQFHGLVSLWNGALPPTTDKHPEVYRPANPDLIEESANEESVDDLEDQALNEEEGSADNTGTDEEDDNGDADTGTANGDSDKDTDEDGDVGTDPSQGEDSESNDRPSEATPTDTETPERGKNSSDSLNDLKEALKEAFKEAMSEKDLTECGKELLKDINAELNERLQHNQFVNPLTAEMSQAAEEVAAGMVNTLEELLSHADPSWQFGKEEGIFDPVRYALSEPGDTDYWINVDDSGARGFDLSVSLLLDVSGSISHQDKALGTATYAVRKACDTLEIPCNVMTFDTTTKILWKSSEEVTPVYPRACGTTNIAGALNALDEQREDKEKQLVIIFTDGEWSDVSNLAPFYAPNRYFLVVGMGYSLRYVLKELGAHSVAIISSPTELPAKVTQELKNFT
jgi:hypothetical protein